MAISVTEMAKTLQEETAWQRTPEPIDLEQYEAMVAKAIKRLYVDTSRVFEYNPALMIISENETGRTILFDKDLPIDEELYVMLCAKIEFFRKVQSDVNNIVGYTTDALSVTNADKPYAHLKDTIVDLDNERRIVYYKMIRYCM